MQQLVFRKYLNDYLINERARLDLLEKFVCFVWTRREFNTREIGPELLNQLQADLNNAGIKNDRPVLYYFEIPLAAELIAVHDSVRRIKTIPGNETLAVARINKMVAGEQSNILYVGKTQKNFLNRLKGHLGLGHSATYSLQLNAWAKELNISLHLLCAQVDVEPKDFWMIARLEEVMHASMRPLMGKRGGLG